MIYWFSVLSTIRSGASEIIDIIKAASVSVLVLMLLIFLYDAIENTKITKSAWVKNRRLCALVFKTLPYVSGVFIACLFLVVFIPKDSVFYSMAGADTVEKIVYNQDIKDIGEGVLKSLKDKIIIDNAFKEIKIKDIETDNRTHP